MHYEWTGNVFSFNNLSLYVPQQAVIKNICFHNIEVLRVVEKSCVSSMLFASCCSSGFGWFHGNSSWCPVKTYVEGSMGEETSDGCVTAHFLFGAALELNPDKAHTFSEDITGNVVVGCHTLWLLDSFCEPPASKPGNICWFRSIPMNFTAKATF